MAAAELAITSADGDPAVPVTILAVDDDPTSRMLTRATLVGQLVRVVEAENGLLGVHMLERQDFDLAVVDLDMPVMDGFGFIERARARPQSRHLPIIVVTGRDDVVAIERAFALGATSFLCKPINRNVFRHQVEFVLHTARTERETRNAKERAEKLVGFHARVLAALQKETEEAAARVAPLLADGAALNAADIASAGRRLRRVLMRVRRACDIVAGSSAIDAGTIPAADLMRDVVERIADELGPDAVDRIEVGPAANASLLGDRALAAEALVETLSNALAYSPARTKVQFSVVPASGGRVRFEVKDHGPGMPEHLVEAGFDDVASSRGDAARGSLGVGLAVARAVIERHGGHFGVLSEPGHGTEVFLSFPAADGEGSVNRAPPISSRKLSEPASLSAS
jgi:CheY-like chemotaxis protein